MATFFLRIKYSELKKDFILQKKQIYVTITDISNEKGELNEK